jgi:hypothetical protein
MADFGTGAKGSDGIAFLVSAGIMYEIIAAACSSPQTTEINAGARADTLMKWVHMGIGQGVIFIAVAAYIDRTHRASIIAGGAVAAGLMYAQYIHAKRAGLASSLPGTESYTATGAAGANGIKASWAKG